MLNQLIALDQVFRAIADPTRRAMVERLAQGEASVTELALPFAMSLPAVHQHLRLLEGSGIVVTSKRGRVRRCRLDVKVLRTAEAWFAQRRLLWERRLDALAEHLARTTPHKPKQPRTTESKGPNTRSRDVGGKS